MIAREIGPPNRQSESERKVRSPVKTIIEQVVLRAMIDVRWAARHQRRLAPPIFVNDFGQRNTTDGSEPAHWIPDRQQGIRVDVRWQTQRGLGLLLELQVQRCQSCAEAECPRREQRVLKGDQSRV